MQRNVRRVTRLAGGMDPLLMLAFMGLVGIGLLMVYSSSISDAYTYYGSPLYVFQREVVWVLLGLGALAAVSRVPYTWWERFALTFLGASLLLLLLVLMPHIGHMSHGARRWFSYGSLISVEPSEFAKLALVIYMASWLTSKGEKVREFKNCFVPFSIIVGVAALFVVREPDLGTTIVLSTTMFAVFFVAGGDLRHLLLVGVGAVGLAWTAAHHSTYQSNRFSAFIDPWKHATGVGYHTVQVLLALGSGGLFGRGLGNSIQKNVLPAPHTDSILAVIGEEWGLLGTVTVLLLFLIVAYRGIRISMQAPDGFSRLLAAGITSWITFQALMNFAVITSSVPFTGVPLPFISYGGTSLIITMTAMGILLNISRHTSGDALARQNTGNGRGNGGTRVPRALSHAVPLSHEEHELSETVTRRPTRAQPGRSGKLKRSPADSG